MPARFFNAVSLAAFLCCPWLHAQLDYSRPYAWQTLAGRAPFGFADGTGAVAQFAHPTGIAVAASGIIYIADTTNCVIRAIAPGGAVTTLAGQPGVNGYRDGTGANALFQYPAGIVAAPDGNLYVTDGSQTIRRVTTAGVVSTVVGTAWVIGSADGHGAAASFWNPAAIAADGVGNLYVGDGSNLTVRKITPTFDVTTLAGSPGQAGATDATGPTARFGTIAGLAVDGSGNVYVADGSNQTIRMITPAGVVTTVAGLAGNAGTADGTGSAARFHNPGGLTIVGGNLVVLDSGSDTVRLMTPAGGVTTFAGTANAYGSSDGTAAAAEFDGPAAVAADGGGNLYIVDGGNSTIRRVTPGAVVTTFAGTAAAVAAEVDGAAAVARFIYPWGVARDNSGNFIVTDSFAHTVRKISPSGAVSTFAGLANVSGTADGVGAAARFNQPAGVVVDSGGIAYIADSGNNTIRKIAADGTVTTFAGNAGVAGSQDGAGLAAMFNNPQGLAIDRLNNVYVADTGNHVIRKITSAGTVSTIAGTPGSSGSADGAAATATFNGPAALCVDGNFAVYVADTGNGTIRKISGGIVSTLAGSAGNWGCADGLGSAAAFYGPEGIAVDGSGVVYVADTFNAMLRRITPGGYVTSIGGVEEASNAIDGVGATAQFNLPIGVWCDAAGDLVVADAGNNVMRSGVAQFTALAISAAPPDQSAVAGGPVQLSVSAIGTGALAYQWSLNNSPLAGASGSTLTLTHAQASDAGTYTVVVTDDIGESVTAGATLAILTAAPTIVTPPASKTVTAGTTASFSVIATGSPTYQWKFNGTAIAGATDSTLAIGSAQPGDAGAYTVTATNAGGAATSDPATLTVVVPLPVITAQPAPQSVAVGGSAQFAVDVTGATSFQWTFNGDPIAGATAASYTVANATVSAAGSYAVEVANAGGSVGSDAAFLTVTALSGGPDIDEQPNSFTAAPGATVILSVDANGASVSGSRVRPLVGSTIAYQWYRDGTVLTDGSGIAGAKSASVRLSGAAVVAGNYTCLISTTTGSVLTQPAKLTVVTTANPGRLINVSSRATVASGAGQLIAGFVVAGGNGPGSAPVLVRASGPALARLGVPDTLSDPELQFYRVISTPELLAANGGWAGDAAIAAAGALVGAFPWTDATSHDAALLETLPAGAYTTNVTSAGGSAGIALVEAYDTRSPGQLTPDSPRLMNISARARAGTGANALIVGFELGGDTARTVLIRASGPALAAFGLGGTLADPKLDLYRLGASVPFATNVGWSGDPSVTTIAATVNAFAWTSPQSADSALLLTLPPGGYTAIVSGATGDSGIALLEVYDVQ